MSTPHNQAKVGQIAKTVLMPGDPLRAKYIAETFLENPVQFNTVRNMYGFTGTYNGKEISVMGSGMGMPSIGIYSYELFKFYGVENIIRIGSAGAYQNRGLKLYDTILVSGAYSDSNYARSQSGDTDKVQLPTKQLFEKLKKTSEELNIEVKVGTILSSDIFYYEDNVLAENQKVIDEYNLLCAEMESFALFHNAKVLGKNASCLLTISDVIGTDEVTSPEERQTAFTNMMKIALEAMTK